VSQKNDASIEAAGAIFTHLPQRSVCLLKARGKPRPSVQVTYKCRDEMLFVLPDYAAHHSSLVQVEGTQARSRLDRAVIMPSCEIAAKFGGPMTRCASDAGGSGSHSMARFLRARSFLRVDSERCNLGNDTCSSIDDQDDIRSVLVDRRKRPKKSAEEGEGKGKDRAGRTPTREIQRESGMRRESGVSRSARKDRPDATTRRCRRTD
jgi:hypothetical protein